jgi:hypothetical protein
MSISALAQDFNVTNVVTLLLSIYALNKCCGILLKMVKPSKHKEVKRRV